MPKNTDPQLQLAIYTLGLVGEAGELAGAAGIKARVKEAGDCYWYAFALANHLGIDLSQDPPLNNTTASRHAAKIAERVKKALGHGEPLDLEAVRVQLLRFLRAVFDACSALSQGAIMGQNVEKLRARYPDGFSVAASLDRKE